MIKKILTIILLIFIQLIVYCKEEVIVSTPMEIKDFVNFYNTTDFAIYKLNLINLLEKNIYFEFYTISIDWTILYGKNNEFKYGVLSPKEIREIYIYTRPLKKTERAPSFIVNLIYDNKSHSYFIFLHPIVLYEKEKVAIPLKVEKIDVFPKEIKRGDLFAIYIEIYNPNNFEMSYPLTFETSYGIKKEKYLSVLPGYNKIKIEEIFPSSISTKNFTIYIKIGNKTYEETIKIIDSEELPLVLYKNGYIIITNPTEDYIYYEFELPISKFDLLLNMFKPNPHEFVIKNNKTYAVWKTVLLPNENYIIKKTINLFFIIPISIVIVLSLILFLLFLYPNIEIRKEIIRISIEEGIIRLAIYIKNNSILPIKNVIIRDKVPDYLKIKKYDIIEPVGLYKEKNETILEWSYDKIKSKEEIILSYTLSIPKEISKTIDIPEASILYEYFIFGEKSENSNKLKITLLE